MTIAIDAITTSGNEPNNNDTAVSDNDGGKHCLVAFQKKYKIIFA